ncbi:hypothetical protein APHAL10511_005591 [Amanita phalloides]|nr:hypothetical protein APHAL10511_005591 [Amanita phalloides]
MNTLYALLIASQLSALPSCALVIYFPALTFNGRSAGGLKGTVNGPVPPVCQQACAPIVPFAVGGQSCTASLCCSSQWEQNYYSCIICAAQAQDITDLTAAQTTLDGINVDCAASGIDLPQLTFPGQPANRTLPSASILPSGTASPTGTGVSGSSTALTASSSSSSGSSTSSSASSPTQSKSAASSIRIQWSVFIVLCTTIAGTLL